MNIFDRIRAKAQAALQGVGNFIDRDKTMAGVQIAPGGIQGGVNRVKQAWQQDPGQFNFITAGRRPTGIQPIDRVTSTAYNNPVARFAENRIVQPFISIPENVGIATDPNRGAGERVVAGISAVGGAIPGIDDAVIGAYDAAKAGVAGRNPISGFTGEEYTGLGDAITGGSDAPLTDILNVAELPLILAVGGLKARNSDAALRSVDEILTPEARVLDDILSGDPATALPRRPRNTMYVTPEGTAFRPKQQPRTTQGLDRILNQVDEALAPKNIAQEGDQLFLPQPKKPLELPEPGAAYKAAQDEAALFEPPKVGVQGVKKGKLATAWDDIVRSSKEVIGKSGPAGARIRQILDTADEEGSITAGKQLDKMQKALKGLSKQEKATLADVIEGRQIPISDAQAQAVAVWKEISSDIFNRARQSGLDIGQIEGYFPHHVLSDEAGEAGKRMMQRTAPRRFGNLELARQSDLPYDKDPSVLLDYISSANRRIAEAKHFGPADEVLYNLANQVAEAGGDGAQVRKYLDQILGKEQNLPGEGVSRAIRTAETVTKLNVPSAFTNLTQNLSTLLRTDARSVGEGIIRAIVNPSEAWSNAVKAGEVTPEMARTLEDYAGSGNVVQKWLTGIGMLGTEKINRVIAVNSGMAYTSKLVDQARNGSGAALRELNRLGFDTSDLDAIDPLLGGRRISQITQFNTEAGQLPYAWKTPLGKVLSQFKSFSYKQTGFLKDQVIRISSEAAKGNFKPLSNAMITYGVAAPIVGEVINNVRSIFYNKERQDTGSFRERYISNILAATSLGLVDNIGAITGEYGTSGQVSSILGPAAGDVVKGVETLQGVGGEEYEQNRSMRNILNQVPLVGRTASNTFIPNSYVDNKDWNGQNLGVNQGLGKEDTKTYESIKKINAQDAEAFKTKTQQEREAENPTLIDRILSPFQGEDTQPVNIPGKGATAEEKKAYRDQLQKVLDQGVVPPEEDLKYYVFKGKSATSQSIDERTQAFESLASAMKNEYYTDEQKQAILDASGARPEDFEYYSLASKDQDARLQEMLPKLDNMENGAMLQFLAQGRRAVAGKQLISNGMIDYLYENNYFGEDEQELLKAIKFDEIQNKFYVSKSFKKKGEGGGKKKLTLSQALSLFKTDFPEFDTPQGLTNLLRTYDSGSQTARGDDTLIENILSAQPQSGRTGGLWF